MFSELHSKLHMFDFVFSNKYVTYYYYSWLLFVHNNIQYYTQYFCDYVILLVTDNTNFIFLNMNVLILPIQRAVINVFFCFERFEYWGTTAYCIYIERLYHTYIMLMQLIIKLLSQFFSVVNDIDIKLMCGRWVNHST